VEAEIESEIIATQGLAKRTKLYATEYLQQEQISNAECANNTKRY